MFMLTGLQKLGSQTSSWSEKEEYVIIDIVVPDDLRAQMKQTRNPKSMRT